tara:strand:+ start:3249 stop:3464 length:216 start_codon:yes stop_codon:yes gene_type:complete
MDEYKKIAESFQENIKKIQILTEKTLSTIREQEPDKVAEILKDQKTTLKALKNKDFETIIKLQKKYADNTH